MSSKNSISASQNGSASTSRAWQNRQAYRQTVPMTEDDDDIQTTISPASTPPTDEPHSHIDTFDLPPSYEASMSPNTTTRATPEARPASPIELDDLRRGSAAESDTIRLLTAEESHIHILPNDTGYRKQNPMKWENLEANGHWDHFDDKPGCLWSSTGGYLFSSRGGCCCSTRGSCCFSDREGCCFSDRGGCCFSDQEACCCAIDGGCCFARGESSCCGFSKRGNARDREWIELAYFGALPAFFRRICK